MLVNHTGYLSTSCVSFFVSFPHLPHGLPPPPPPLLYPHGLAGQRARDRPPRRTGGACHESQPAPAQRPAPCLGAPAATQGQVLIMGPAWQATVPAGHLISDLVRPGPCLAGDRAFFPLSPSLPLRCCPGETPVLPASTCPTRTGCVNLLRLGDAPFVFFPPVGS